MITRAQIFELFAGLTVEKLWLLVPDKDPDSYLKLIKTYSRMHIRGADVYEFRETEKGKQYDYYGEAHRVLTDSKLAARKFLKAYYKKHACKKHEAPQLKALQKLQRRIDRSLEAKVIKSNTKLVKDLITDDELMYLNGYTAALIYVSAEIKSCIDSLLHRT